MLGLVLAACGEDHRPIGYLQSLEEDALAYPGATELSATAEPQKPGIEGPSRARSIHTYAADATEDEILDWYRDEFGSRGWRYQPLSFTSAPDLPSWRKGFVEIQLHFRTADDVATGLAEYRLELLAQPHSFDEEPLAVLQALPELELKPPEAEIPRGGGESDRSRQVSADNVTPATVERSYRSPASPDEIAAFFEAELASRGWTLLDPPPGDPNVTSSPLRAWEKDGLVARIDVRSRRGNDGEPLHPPVHDVRFSIVEELGPDATPGLPWD